MQRDGSSRLPGLLGRGGEVVEMAAEVEEVVAQAVEVADGEGVDRSGLRQGDYPAFGTPADGAGDVGLACGLAPSGKDE